MSKAGYIRIVMCEEGWFWLIPLDEDRTSIGLVLDAGRAREAGVAADRMLAWGIERSPRRERWSLLSRGVVGSAVPPCEPLRPVADAGRAADNL